MDVVLDSCMVVSWLLKVSKNNVQHIPPEEAGAKAAEAPIREARIASFIISNI
jgi:hypothetical protein